MNRHFLGGLVCGLALLLATSCSGGGLDADGPFGNGGPYSGSSSVCLRPGQLLYDGFEAFPNKDDTATIQKVVLVHSRSLRLVAAWVVPLYGLDEVGFGVGYPSASRLASTAPGVLWRKRQRVPGAVVGHTYGHDLINLVVLVKPSGKTARTNAFNLYYESGGTHYLLHFAYGLKISVYRTCVN